jgi:hypothetical protein
MAKHQDSGRDALDLPDPRLPERRPSRTTMATATAAQAATATQSMNRPIGAIKPRLAAFANNDVATCTCREEKPRSTGRPRR